MFWSGTDTGTPVSRACGCTANQGYPVQVGPFVGPLGLGAAVTGVSSCGVLGEAKQLLHVHGSHPQAQVGDLPVFYVETHHLHNILDHAVHRVPVQPGLVEEGVPLGGYLGRPAQEDKLELFVSLVGDLTIRNFISFHTRKGQILGHSGKAGIPAEHLAGDFACAGGVTLVLLQSMEEM